MPLVPWWALLSSGCAPVVLIAGWALAASLQPAGYDPMVQSISALAAHGAADPWLMTCALYLLGVCHLVTAVGLRAAALAGRVALACGGVASIMVALSPEPGAGATSPRHLASTGVGFTVLALWPVLAAVRRRGATWALLPATGYTVTALMAAGAAWFLFELHGHGDAGFVERVLTGAQSIWPFIVVAACLAGRLRAPATPLPADAARSGSPSAAEPSDRLP